ncbi:MAG: peptidylprolyl isomerase, partial [Bacteroidales bacterium]|nr:peptidylprolyl isomerase [Bacteroidales bacterium]
MKLVYKILFISIIMVSSFRLNAQSEAVVVDEVIAIVGGEMIMLSDLENMYQQYKSNMPNITKCDVLDDLLFQKLLVTQAALDSVEVNESAVDMELDNRIRYFTAQFGSKEKFEKFYGKTVPEIKEEFRTAIKEQMLVETVKGNITANTKITPSEVKEYYNNLSFDEVPEIPTQYEIGQILKQPKMSSAELEEAYNKIADLRKRIVAGEDFATLAMLYSEDPGSASQGGAIGTVGRGDTYPDFEAAAFALKNGEISEIVKTEAGYHIIKMLSRKGDYIDVLHILIRPKVSPYELYNAKNYLDSVYKVFYADSMTFEAAAKKFSDDPSKINGGLLINSYTGGSMFEANQLNNQD